MQFNNSAELYNHVQILNDQVATAIAERASLPVTWNTIFPASCYHSGFPFSLDRVTMLGRANIGEFKRDGYKHTKDIPTIEFANTSDYVDLYKRTAHLQVTSDEIDRFRMWTQKMGLADTSIVNQLADAAVQIYNETHNDLFFKGDSPVTQGLFNNPAIGDIGLVGDYSSDDLSTDIIQAVAKIRTITGGVIKAGTLMISPRMYALLSKYTTGCDVSNLDKLITFTVNTVSGTPIKLKLNILDVMSGLASPTKETVYFMDDSPSQFAYYYQPLIIKNFVNTEPDLFKAACVFKHSDPYIYTKYAISKGEITVPAPTTIDEPAVKKAKK